MQKMHRYLVHMTATAAEAAGGYSGNCLYACADDYEVDLGGNLHFFLNTESARCNVVTFAVGCWIFVEITGDNGNDGDGDSNDDYLKKFYAELKAD